MSGVKRGRVACGIRDNVYEKWDILISDAKIILSCKTTK
jgi:hypothetical protein